MASLCNALDAVNKEQVIWNKEKEIIITNN